MHPAEFFALTLNTYRPPGFKLTACEVINKSSNRELTADSKHVYHCLVFRVRHVDVVDSGPKLRRETQHFDVVTCYLVPAIKVRFLPF